jgi:hypothetical protein
LFDFGIQGNDDNNNYFGRGIYQSYNDRPFDEGHGIAEHNRSNLFIGSANVFWMLNPALRLRVELGYTYRQLTFDNPIPGDLENQSHSVLNFALRTNIFNRYYDF